MEILKRHKGLTIVGGLAFILLILLIIICSKMFLSKNGGVYGNRLNNIEKISDGEIKKVTNAIEEKEEVSSVNIRIQGKIIIINIKYKNSTNKNKALEIANDLAAKLGHNYIGTEHLLLGLIREGEGVAARVLENLGVDLNKIRTNVVKMLGESKSQTVSSGGGSSSAPTSKVKTPSLDEYGTDLTLAAAAQYSRRHRHLQSRAV